MKYTLKRPCPHCPFRKNVRGYLRGDRAVEIAQSLMSGATFACHETTVDVEDEDGFGDRVETADSQHCAGALVMLERMELPNQSMRIAERLGMYDRRSLDMDAPVFNRVGDFIGHHARSAK